MEAGGGGHYTPASQRGQKLARPGETLVAGTVRAGSCDRATEGDKHYKQTIM